MPNQQQHAKKWRAMRWLEALTRRPHLSYAIVLMIVVYAVIPSHVDPTTRLFSAWNTGVWCYILSAWWLMSHTTVGKIRLIARQQHDSAPLILGLMSVAAIISLLAIIIELPTLKSLSGTLRDTHIALTALTLVGTWILIPTTFTIYYAHAYYVADKPILLFPEAPAEPSYADFLYFSFTIAVASQTADVAIASAQVRRIVLIQSVLAFVFNTSLLGLTINVASGLLG